MPQASFKFRWAICGTHEKCMAVASAPSTTNTTDSAETSFVMWHAAAKQYGGSSPGPYVPFPSDSAVSTLVDTFAKNGLQGLPYMSCGLASTRNASVYIDRVRAWKERYHIQGVYSDGLAEDDWLVAYEEVRMLRELFPNGTLIFHDTLHHGMPVAEFRPFLHTYATATLMSEGVHSSNGTSWQWPRYAVSQFRRSNAFGDGVYSHWTDKGGGSHCGLAHP